MKEILNFSIEEEIRGLIENNIKDIKLFFIVFAVNIVIYGQKLFFYTLSVDDYGRFYSGGGEQASEHGRWMATIINQNIFTGSLHILPYFNGIIGIFSLTLAGFLMAKFLKRTSTLEIFIITFLVSATPMLAHNLFYNTNISTWISTLIGVIGLLLAYKSSKIVKLFGFILLVLAIACYQTIIQVTLAMIIIKTIIDVIEAKDIKELNIIALNTTFYIVFILFAFVISNFVNYLYMEYNNLEPLRRMKEASYVHGLTIYFKRIFNMYHMELKLKYFKDSFIVLYGLMALFGIVAALFAVFKSKQDKNTRIISVVLLGLLFFVIPLVINLPLITGSEVPLRAHYTIGWFMAGFFVIQLLSFNGILKTITIFVTISIIILSAYYINVFFDAASRQTSSDITRANQIATRIRANKNYATEPMKFKIVGKSAFTVTGWKGKHNALFNNVSMYKIFKNFTDLKFTKMNDEEYNEMADYLIQKGKVINAYPGENSIVVYNNKAVLFFNSSKINAEITFLTALQDREPDIKSDFNLWLKDKYIYYKKSPCAKEDTKHFFYLQIYPVDKTVLPKAKQKHGYAKMGFSFSSYGKINDNTCIAIRELPEYDILKLRTGQYHDSKRDWDVTYSFEDNNTH